MAISSHHTRSRMIGQNPSQPAFFQMVELESLVPANHRLRQIDSALDLSFVREAVAACYTPRRGRPSIDPELAVRMMILGVLYDLSDRQLCDEIRMHAGYRWFCRLNFHDSVPDHSTLSRLRNERWAKSELFKRLFDEVLGSCVKAGMVSGRHVSIDGTQIQANASMQSLERRSDDTENSRKEDDTHENDLPEEPPALNLKRTASKASSSAAFKDPQGEGAWKARGERYSNETHVSRTDSDAKLYKKGGQGARLSYIVHDVIDTKSRVILGRRASIATGTAEREVALELLDEHEERRSGLGLKQAVEVLSADAGYGTGDFVADVVDRQITPHVPLQARDELEEVPSWQRRTFDLGRHRKRREMLRQVLARNQVRLAQREHGYTISRKLRIRSEHIFAEAKNQHGLGRARQRGLDKVDRQSLLTAIVQNLKRLGGTLWRRANSPAADSGYFDAFLHLLRSVITLLNTSKLHRRRSSFADYIGTRIGAPSNYPAQKLNCSTAF